MAIENKDILKSYFETGAKPTEGDFATLIDSLLHVNELSNLNLTKASPNEAQEGDVDDRYMTPYLVKEAIISLTRLSIIPNLAREVQNRIDTAINNLISGAPTALDTLNELAAALNDNADFAATVTNALATKEPAITKKSGFNLEKTDSTHADYSNKLATSKAVNTLRSATQTSLNDITEALVSKEPAITKKSGFNLEKSDSTSLVSSETLATSSAVKIAYDKAVEAYNKQDRNTWRPVSDSTSSDHSNTSASSKAVKIAYDKAVEAYNKQDRNTWRGISDSTSSDHSNISASSKAVKIAYDKAVEAYNKQDRNTWRGISDSTSSDHSNISASSKAVKTAYDKANSAYNRTHNLSDSTSSTSTTTGASSRAVKTAYDKANSAYNRTHNLSDSTSSTSTTTGASSRAVKIAYDHAQSINDRFPNWFNPSLSSGIEDNGQTTLRVGCAGKISASGSRVDWWGLHRVLDGSSHYPFRSQKISNGLYKIIHDLGDSTYGFVGSGAEKPYIKASMKERHSNYCIVGVSDDHTLNTEAFSFIIFDLN